MGASIVFQNGAGMVWLDDIVVMPTAEYNALPETTLDVEAGVGNVENRHTTISFAISQ